jgi:hypothetical protein
LNAESGMHAAKSMPDSMSASRASFAASFFISLP